MIISISVRTQFQHVFPTCSYRKALECNSTHMLTLPYPPQHTHTHTHTRLYLCHDVVGPDVGGGGDAQGLGDLGLGGPEQGGAEHGGQVVQGHLVDRLLLCHPTAAAAAAAAATTT